jgi:transcriptional regulator with GAF, ATPase, and Fis domain
VIAGTVSLVEEYHSMNENLMSKSDILIDLASLLGQQSDYQEVLRLITQKAADMVMCDIALIMMLNPQTRHTLKTVHAVGTGIKEKQLHFVHTNISGWVFENNQSFLTQDLKKDDRFNRSLFKDIAIQSAACVPFRTEGVIIGTLLLLSAESKAVFQKEDLIFLEKYSAVVSPFLRNLDHLESYFISTGSAEALKSKYEVCGLMGKSIKFMELLHAIEAAARCDVRVLLEGKSGTGKELIANAIHKGSARNGHKFIAIDCGAIPQQLIESELFGHVKGAFTGATAGRKGLFEEAHEGTLFMDEITNLPIDLQAKLLRVLQEGEIRPLGSNATRKVNVRIIAAASASLKDMIHEKQFREDLFYRLMVYPIHVPSLEEREEDIPLLAAHFLHKFAGEQNKMACSFHEELIDFMKSHSWPGNIRELENFVERMVTLTPSEKKQIDIELLPQEFREELKESRNRVQVTRSLNDSLAEYEENLIRKALEDHRWNQSRAARALRVSEQTLRYKINKLGISKSS